MSDTSNVIKLRPHGDSAGGNIACCGCGSQWFIANVCLTAGMALSAVNDLRCHECGDHYNLDGAL